MESLRPQVDQQVLDFIGKCIFTPGDFTLTSDGVCRLHPQLARTVSQLSALGIGASTSPSMVAEDLIAGDIDRL